MIIFSVFIWTELDCLGWWSIVIKFMGLDYYFDEVRILISCIGLLI